MKITKEQLFNFQKSKYNGFKCGYGVFKNKKNMIEKIKAG